MAYAADETAEAPPADVAAASSAPDKMLAGLPTAEDAGVVYQELEEVSTLDDLMIDVPLAPKLRGEPWMSERPQQC